MIINLERNRTCTRKCHIGKADSVLNDKRQLIPVSACLDGQYGHSDVAIGVPAVIGKDGIHEIIELELDDAEKSVFDAGVTNVKNAIKSMDL